MNTRLSKNTTLAILLVAGSTLPASLALAQRSGDGRPADRAELIAAPATLHFVKASKLLGSDVRNANDENLGSVADLVVDRGEGNIRAVVIRDGGILGFGGHLVAVPYEAFGIAPDGDRLTLNVTPEMIERAPEFTTRGWLELHSEEWADELSDAYRDARQRLDPDARDPYRAAIDGAQTIDIEGTVTSVERDSALRGEEIAIHVRAEDGGQHRVVLGPSWYVMSQTAAPMRGDSVKLTAYRVPRDGEDSLVARGATIAGRPLSLRADDGAPRWDATDEAGEPRTADNPVVRMTEIIGAPATARTQEGGEIANAVIELRSGRVAMLTLDPNENFLGIADDIKCVPWSIAAVGPESVRIDADRDMLLNCESLPDEVTVFAAPARLEPVYTVFDVEVVTFEPVERLDAAEARDAWSGDGPLARAFERGRPTRFSGTVTATSTVQIAGAADRIHAITVSGDDGDRLVLVGPEWFVGRQDINLRERAVVSGDARTVEIDGREYTLAEHIATADGKRINLWSGKRPAWAHADD